MFQGKISKKSKLRMFILLLITAGAITACGQEKNTENQSHEIQESIG